MNKEEIIRKEIRLIIRELGLLNYNCLNSELTLAQAHILNYLKQNGTTSFNELLMHLGIDKASLSRILNNLENKNFIEMKKSEMDKRMKVVDILPLGMETIIEGDYKANKYINEILTLGKENNIDNITKSFREFRILALKNNLIKSCSRIVLEKVSSNYMEDAINLAIDVFTNEQNIPESLVPIEEPLKPTWWCARVGEDIIGVVASWEEEGKFHFGRYAIDKRLRGIGIGKKLAIFSLKEIFNLGVEEIFSEGRDITVNMLKNFGCHITGEAMDFYGEPVTPITINRDDFMDACKKEKY